MKLNAAISDNVKSVQEKWVVVSLRFQPDSGEIRPAYTELTGQSLLELISPAGHCSCKKQERRWVKQPSLDSMNKQQKKRQDGLR